METEFEWDEAKAIANLRKHHVAFEDARFIFDDLLAYYRADADGGYGEQRSVVTGLVNGILLTAVYTDRGIKTRLISARKATRYEQINYHRNQAHE